MNQEENTPWQYKPDNGKASVGATQSDNSNRPSKEHAQKSVAWEAAEFIEHHHGSGWYTSLVAGFAALAALVYLVSRDFVATGIIIILGFILGAYARQKPGLAEYEITDRGLSVNGKVYNYGNFKSFAIIREGELSSVSLFPLKRLTPPVSAYFEPKDEQKIVQTLGDYLPYEDRKLDSIDRLSRRLRL